MAFDGDYSITITPFNCTSVDNQQPGIQIGIYTDCTFSESVFCNSDCGVAPVSIDSDDLTPGSTYYLFIDGCFGSVCSYEIDINGNPSPPFISPSDLCILDEGLLTCEDQEFAINKEINFVVEDVQLNEDYTWSITTLTGGPFTGNSNPITESNSISLSFENEGIYSVCIDQIDNSCPSFQWNGSTCRTVTISTTVDVDDIVSNEITIVPNPTYDFISIDGDVPESNVDYTIYSIQGEQIMSGKLDQLKKINVVGLSTGLYLISISARNGQEVKVGRFVKK